jgi:hypothetical protein
LVDVAESPAVPPTDYGGDERLGLQIAGGLLVVLGWGLGVALNVLLHVTAPSGGRAVGPVVVFAHLGLFAWATLLIGLGTGALGAAIVLVGRASPKGPIVLPGFGY